MLVFYPYEDRFLDGSGLPLVLHAYDVETGFCGAVSCLLYVQMDGGGLFKVLLVSLSKGPGCLPYVFFITVYVIALETVDYPTHLLFGVLVLRFHEDLFDCCVALEVSLYPIFTTGVFEPFWNLVLNWLLVLYLQLDCCLLELDCCCPQFVFVVPC